MNTRRTLVASCCALLLASMSIGALGAAAPPDPVPDFLRAYSIIPPGQSGSALTHTSDQYEMYKDFIDDGEITDPDLETLFHSFEFGPGTTIESEYSPRSDVTI